MRHEAKKLAAYVLCLLQCVLCCTPCAAVPTAGAEALLRNLEMYRPKSGLGLLAGYITTTHQDATGYVWIGTSLGLYRYDGYQTKRYRNTHERGNLLTSNKIVCISHHGNSLLVGTDRGLTILGLDDGSSRHYHFDDFFNCDYVNRILVCRDGTIWVGTEGGLYRYDQSADRFTLMCDQRGNSRVPHCAVKSVIEDHKGCLWVGTWDKGLFRYNPDSDEWYELPRFNDINSAHVVLDDSRHRLWVGTWGKGLYLIHNPHDTNVPLRFDCYTTAGTGGVLPSNTIYSLAEDDTEGLLWIGTLGGLALHYGEGGDGRFVSIPDDKLPIQGMFDRGADLTICDRAGNVWVNSKSAGLVLATLRPRVFTHYPLPERYTRGDVVSCVGYDHHNNIWIGLDRGGLAYMRRGSHEVTDVPDTWPLREAVGRGRVNGISLLADNTLALSTNTRGLLLIDSTHTRLTALNRDNTPWLLDNCVYTATMDQQGNMLVGSYRGLSVRYADGGGAALCTDSLSCLDYARVRCILPASDGTLWLGTSNMGVFHVTGDLRRPATLRTRRYNRPKGTVLLTDDLRCLTEDRQGRVWTCSEETGLMMYSPDTDSLVCANRLYGLPDDEICAMQMADDGAIWMASRQNLMRLYVGSGKDDTKMLYFPQAQGGASVFGHGMSAYAPNGEICFLGQGGLTMLGAGDQYMPQSASSCAHITDIRVMNQPLEALPDAERHGITTLLPPYTGAITVKPSLNDFTIEFSSLVFGAADEVRFAYILEGYDRQWTYVEAGHNTAYYCNLPSGTYTFRLRSTDAGGMWIDCPQTLTVHVLPPVWARWYMLTLYAMLLAVLVYMLYRYLLQRERQRRELQLARMASEQIEQLNHKKLQFFTNITHDLMTPLTVIQATISDLWHEAPQYRSAYEVISSNLQRQMRLLQEILEFRKIETGHIQLRVSQGTLSEFIRRDVESIQPLMKSRKLHLSFLCTPDVIEGYFDTDAVDKILYNLLSNAAKYTSPMGFVQVTLVAEAGTAVLTVKDNGCGIPKDRQPELFTRFYEGEHRRFSTYGTGIGLSLTRDLVQLHHGAISVDSAEGEGTTFTVTIPILREAYTDAEVDEAPPQKELPSPRGEGDITQWRRSLEIPSPRGESQGRASSPRGEGQGGASILIVEDNDELLNVMRNLLQRHYNTLVAYNGAEALELLRHNTVDLVVADVMMPVMDGIEMLRQLREDKALSTIPVVMLTAKRSDEDRAQAYNAGADAYITKPFHLPVLLARIQNLLHWRTKAIKDIKDSVLDGLGDLQLTDADEEFINRCVVCVREHLSEPDFDQQQFADLMSVSKSTLYKKLKTHTNLNTSAFVRNVRMKAACEILVRTPNIRISDLAYAVGYNDPKYFSACFKKDLGCLPSEYLT